MIHSLIQFALENKTALAIAGCAIFSIMTTALPDDLSHFNWRTYIPTVLKAISATANHKPVIPKE